MEKYFNWLSVAFGVVGGVLVQLLGGWDVLLRAVVILVVLDYITGFIKAAYHKELSSGIGFRGILKKVVVFIVIITAHLLSDFVGDMIPLREVVIMFFVANEGLSLVENAATLIPLPEKLKEVLMQIRDNKKGE